MEYIRSGSCNGKRKKKCSIKDIQYQSKLVLCITSLGEE